MEFLIELRACDASEWRRILLHVHKASDLFDLLFYGSSKAPDEPIGSTLRRKQEEVAAKVIQRAFRKGREAQEQQRPADAPPLGDALE